MTKENEMPNPTRLAKHLPGATTVVAMVPDGDLTLFWTVAVNGVATDYDYAHFATTAERDEALTRTVALYRSNGFNPMEGLL